MQKTAEKHHVDPNLVRAVISTESNWNASAVSRKGALGLMQLIPGTAQRLGVGNAFDPAQNVDAGVRYLGMLLERYNGDLNKTLAAYNAGPGAVDRFGGVPNFRETRNYVEKVTATLLQTRLGGTRFDRTRLCTSGASSDLSQGGGGRPSGVHERMTQTQRPRATSALRGSTSFRRDRRIPVCAAVRRASRPWRRRSRSSRRRPRAI